MSAQLGVLGAVVAGLAAFVHVDKSVTVQIDGSSRHVRTFAGTVSGVLAQAHVSVGPHDRVVPGPAARVDDHDTIVVERGRPITLTVGQRTRTVWVTATTVHDALDQLQLDRPGEWVSALGSDAIGPAGMSLDVRVPQRVRLVVDGRSVDVTTTRARVADLLADHQVRLGPRDRLSVPSTAYPVDGMVVDVKTYPDGTLTGRRLVARQVRVPSRPAVVAYGTRSRPAPQQVSVGYQPAGSGGVNWPALARCESGGNPRAVSAGGTYRGLYQFSMGTWQGVGGSGDPINASAAEQTHRAQLLYARSGRAAWPACGGSL